MKTFIVSIVVIVVVIGAFFVFTQMPTPLPEPVETGCQLNDTQIIVGLENVWNDFEKDIPSRPVLGAEAWLSPYHFQFIGNDRALIAFEDGHIVVASLVEFECEEDDVEEFSVVDNVSVEFPFTEESWNDLISQYGNTESVRTYTNTSIFIDGELVEINEWTPIEENIFVQ